MKKYFTYLFFLSLIFSLKIFAQDEGLIVKNIIISDSPIKIDTNFISQNEFNIYKNNKVIADSLYHLNFSNGIITFHKTLNKDTVLVSYKLLYPDITFSRRDTSIYIPVIENEQVFLDTYNYKKNKSQNLQTNGTIQRSFSSGNNQNFSINTDVDLRISGKISENLFLDCNISDSSIPIDYGQSTTSLQELDKVYIKLYNEKAFLKGGDIIISNLENPFLKFYRNAIGLTYNHVDTHSTKNVSIGVTKNMFRRQLINPINGNQGPYKLSGNNEEIYVLIVPNSENVFIDGVKKEKGTAKDYTINYNTGEIIFTPNTLINENQRIIIEFQYSGQNYFRWLSHAGTNFKKGDFMFKFSVFSEQDSKDSPITLFSNDQINQMAAGGDEDIFSNNFNSVEFSPNSSQILYAIKDSVDLSFVQYDSIYVFSNNPMDTLYNVNFEYVGENQGNYILDTNIINGNIFIWVSPLNGVSQGDYEPQKLLIPPQKKQMFTAGFDYVKKEKAISFNIGVSNHDRNTFSNLGDENNIAWAMNFLAKKSFRFKKFNLQSKINYDFVDKKFIYIDRTRDLEFLRNWNIEDSILSQSNQHKINIQILSDFFKLGKTSYALELMNVNKYYKFRHLFNADLKKNSFSTNVFTSILKDHAINKNILFLQYDFLLQKTGKLKFGVNNIGEQKKDYLDPLNKTSFNKLVLFSTLLKKDRNLLDINYINRVDIKPQNIGSLNENSVEIKTFLIKNKNATLNIQSSYSSYNSNIQDSIKKEENIMGRLNYSIKINTFLNINGFYEISNGKEFLRDFRFIKVNPGYGSFSWIDYNNNGLEEFDEFENSNFSDTADYIRISFPTNEFFNVRNLKYHQQINLHPNFSKNKFSSFFSRTRNSFNIQIEKKFLDDDLATIINPFSINFSSPNTLSLNFNILNHFTYKSHNNKYFIAYKTKKSLLKNTLNYGEESTNIISHNMQGQRTFGFMILNIYYEYSSCSINNQNMINRNYMIDKNEIRSEISFDFKKITPSIMLTSVNKKNNNDETLNGQKLHLSIDFLGPKKISLNSSIIAFNMNYTGNAFSSLGHDMLDGLSDGKGLDIQFSILKSINQTNLSIQYTGRLNEQNIFHSARFEFKRYF